jgi:hypothetical protein
MSTLTEIRDRALVMLGDPAGSRFSTELLDGALIHALDEYSHAVPQALSCVVTVSVAGREQPLEVPGSIKTLVRAQYPYTDENSPFFEQLYLGYTQGAPAVLFAGRTAPQAGEQFKIYYTASQTLSGLLGAEVTSLPAAHEGLLVEGAAGFACYFRAARLSESMSSSITMMMQLGAFHMANFRAGLAGAGLEVAFEYPLEGFALED